MIGALFSCPGRPWTAQEGPRTAAGALGVCEGPGSRKTLVNQAIDGRWAASPAPEVSSSSRRKRAGFAAHGGIIADGPGNGKGAGRANRALSRAEINGGSVKSPVFGVSITAIGAGRSVTRCYSSRAKASDAEPWAQKISPGQRDISSKTGRARPFALFSRLFSRLALRPGPRCKGTQKRFSF